MLRLLRSLACAVGGLARSGTPYTVAETRRVGRTAALLREAHGEALCLVRVCRTRFARSGTPYMIAHAWRCWVAGVQGTDTNHNGRFEEN